MSLRTIGLLLALFVATSTVGVSWLFWVQNSQRRVMLSLNLAFAKFELAEAVPAPALLGIALGSGFLLGVTLTAMLWWRSSSRARHLADRARVNGEGPPW
jgi:uncharacterized membrane protein YciS (DUF1049 family)